MADELNVMPSKGTADVFEFTRFEHATVGVFYMLFCVIGVTSNFLTALTFYKDTRLITTSKPWLHILLALFNIGVVAPSPFPASSCFSGRWLYGKTMCQFYAFEGMFVGIGAIMCVVALCLERHFVDSKKLSADTSSWFHMWAAILIVGNALFWATMPLLGWSSYAVEYSGTSCALDWKNPDEGFVSYIISLEVFSFAIPMGVALFCLCCANSKTPRESGPSASGQEAAAVTNQAVAGFTEDQLAMVCYVFLAVVVVGWGPFAFLCTSVMVRGSQGLSMLAATIPPLACKMMVSAYPLTYAIVNPRFRNSMTSIIGGREQPKQD